MTTTEGTQSNAESSTEEVSELEHEHEVNGVPVPDPPTEEFYAAGPASHRRPPHWQTITSREISLDRKARLRLLAGSLVGAGCLVLAYRLQPGDASPFAAPSGVVGWIALIAGITGIWFVPGLWLSAVMTRIGIGMTARLATRIGTTLAWYALVGPAVHVSAEGASVTAGGIIGVTVAATAAVCLGVALGLVRRPANPSLRVPIAALAGAICAQTVIWLSMWLFTDGVNYEQIRRLDWLIVLACALLSAVGTGSRPDLPLLRTASQIRLVLLSLAVLLVTAVALLAVGSIWSPVQRMPSAIGVEQVAAPPGADVAFALTAIGPEGQDLIKRSSFTARDDSGRPVSVGVTVASGSTADSATLLLVVDPVSRPLLCMHPVGDSLQSRPFKLTVRDQTSGVLVQAVVPPGWCAQ
jgi:hypothetical protein